MHNLLFICVFLSACTLFTLHVVCMARFPPGAKRNHLLTLAYLLMTKS